MAGNCRLIKEKTKCAARMLCYDMLEFLQRLGNNTQNNNLQAEDYMVVFTIPRSERMRGKSQNIQNLNFHKFLRLFYLQNIFHIIF